jgi:hypothetical protein
MTPAAQAVRDRPGFALERLHVPAPPALRLVGRAPADELAARDPAVIAVAAIARAVDARLLAAVLPGTDGDRAEASLRTLSVARRVGTRVTLAGDVRAAVRATLLAENRWREHELRRRLADHLYARAALGEQRLSLDLAELIDDETLRPTLDPPLYLMLTRNERERRHASRDWGAGGVLGFLRDCVYRELGLPPPATGTPTEVAAETVREALRCFRSASRLAANPLARGGAERERAESVRRLVRNAVAETFGDSPSERLLHAVVVRGYLAADGGHERAQLELYVSRTTYFRRLGEASARVAQHLVAALG